MVNSAIIEKHNHLLDEQRYDEAAKLILSAINTANNTADKLCYQTIYAKCLLVKRKKLFVDKENISEEQLTQREGLLKEAATILKGILVTYNKVVRNNEMWRLESLFPLDMFWGLKAKVSFLLLVCAADPYDSDSTFFEVRRLIYYVLESRDNDEIEYAKELLNERFSYREFLIDDKSGVEKYKSLAETLDFVDRSAILFVKNEDELAGMVDEEGNIPLVCTVKDYPYSIHLPIGHPKSNTLYFAHPVKPDVYLPFETAYDVLFIEKVKEFCYLCQCLGATEIKFKMTKGSNSSSQSNIMNKLGLEVGVKGVGVDGSFDENIDKKSASTAKRAHEITYSYEPMRYPYVPDDLVWLKNNEDWNNLVRQRMNGGNMLSYTEYISSYDSSNTSTSHNLQLKASFSNLICKVDASFERNVEQTFSNIEEKEISISVKFKSIDQLQVTSSEVGQDELPVAKDDIDKSNKHSEAVKVIIDKIKTAIKSNGKISSFQAVLLEQLRRKLGLSKEFVDTLIAEYTGSYTDNEKQYMKAVSTYIVNGAIDDESKTLLTKLAQVLEIDEKRALELQSKCLNENNG